MRLLLTSDLDCLFNNRGLGGNSNTTRLKKDATRIETLSMD